MTYEQFFTTHIKKLNVRTSGQATGCCPLHDDRHASFSCHVHDGVWTCHSCEQSGNVIQLAQRLGVEAPLKEKNKLTEIARYTYHDAARKPYMQVRRYLPKTFRQFRSDGHGGWLPGLQGNTPILYHLPEVERGLSGLEELRKEIRWHPYAIAGIASGGWSIIEGVEEGVSASLPPDALPRSFGVRSRK